MSNSITIPLDRKLADVVQAAIEATFRDSFQIQTNVSAWSLENGPLALEPYVACSIRMSHAETNEACGTLIIGLSHETIHKILGTFGLGDTTNEQVINDAAEELMNMIYGMIKTSLGKDGFPLNMEFPSTNKKELSSLSATTTSGMMILPFSTEGHQCCVIVAHIF